MGQFYGKPVTDASANRIKERTHEEQKGEVTSPCVTNDGRSIGTLSDDHTTSIKTAASVRHQAVIQNPGFRPDSPRLVSAAVYDDRTIKGVDEGDNLVEKTTKVGHAYKCIFHHTPDTLNYWQVTTFDRTAHILKLDEEDKWLEKTIVTHDDEVASAGFSFDGRHVMTTTISRTSRILTFSDSLGNWLMKGEVTPEGSLMYDSRHLATVPDHDPDRIFNIIAQSEIKFGLLG